MTDFDDLSWDPRIKLRAEPQVFGIFFEWDKEASEYGGGGGEGFSTCYYTLYYKVARSNERWKSLRVQPNNVMHFWLYGLVPSEVYAARIRPWCGSKTIFKHSSMLHVKTLPLFKGFTEGPVRSLDQEPGLSAHENLAEPWGLAVNYTGDLSSNNPPLSISLVWKQESSVSLHPPTLSFQVEYSFFSGAAVAKPNWKTLAPVDGNLNEMVLLAKGQHLPSSNQYENVFETGVMFRIRAFGLMVSSKASSELLVPSPLGSYVGQALRIILAEDSGHLQQSLEEAAKDLQDLQRKYASLDGVMLDESVSPKTSSTRLNDESPSWWKWWSEDHVENHITWSVIASLLFIVCFFGIGLIVVRKVTKSAHLVNKYCTAPTQNSTNHEMNPWTPSHPVYASLPLHNQTTTQNTIYHECEANDTFLNWKAARATLGSQYAVDLTNQRPETYEILPTSVMQECTLRSAKKMHDNGVSLVYIGDDHEAENAALIPVDIILDSTTDKPIALLSFSNHENALLTETMDRTYTRGSFVLNNELGIKMDNATKGSRKFQNDINTDSLFKLSDDQIAHL